MERLTLERASHIIDATLRAGRERNMKPLTVVVLDAGGHDIALKREDGSGILRVEIARGKAWGALGLGLGSRELGRRAEQNPRFYVALAATSMGRMIPNPGGVLIRCADGSILGAVGVSGDHADHDEDCALAGVREAGFTGDPG